MGNWIYGSLVIERRETVDQWEIGALDFPGAPPGQFNPQKAKPMGNWIYGSLVIERMGDNQPLGNLGH